MIIENRFTVLPLQPPLLARKLFERGPRVLLLGAPGVGKSTLAGKLAFIEPVMIFTDGR